MTSFGLPSIPFPEAQTLEISGVARAIGPVEGGVVYERSTHQIIPFDLSPVEGSPQSAWRLAWRNEKARQPILRDNEEPRDNEPSRLASYGPDLRLIENLNLAEQFLCRDYWGANCPSVSMAIDQWDLGGNAQIADGILTFGYDADQMTAAMQATTGHGDDVDVYQFGYGVKFESLGANCEAGVESTELRLTLSSDDNVLYEIVMKPDSRTQVRYMDRSGDGVVETTVIDSACPIAPGNQYRTIVTLDENDDRFFVDIIDEDASDPGSAVCSGEVMFYDSLPINGELKFEYTTNCTQRRAAVQNMNLCF